MFFSGISWFPVIVAAIVAFIGGWIWYSPSFFGKIYAREMGWPEAPTKEERKKGMVKKFGIVLLGQFVMATVASALINSLFIISFSQILLVVLSLWAAFVLVTKMNDVLFGNKSWKLYAINVGQDLLSTLIIFIVISFLSR